MPYYELSGKWYHLSYSHGVREVVEAKSPAAALRVLIEDTLGCDEDGDVLWDERPARVRLGEQEPEIRFTVNFDQLYAIRHIARVEAREGTCSACGGSGTAIEYVPVRRGGAGTA